MKSSERINIRKDPVLLHDNACYLVCVCGVWRLPAQKPINRPGWWKGNFALFQMLTTGCAGGWQTFVQKLTLAPPQAGGENFYRQSVGRWATCRMSTVISLRVIFKLVTAVLTSIVLVVLVNLYFQGPFIPISFQPILRIVTAHVLGKVWSSCS